MTDEKRPLKVFLCHASADKPKVRELYRYLKRRGLQPWLDAEDLLPGQNWQVEIPKALETSDAIIICLSKGSVDKEGYVQKEIKFALDRALEMPEGRIFLIPARLEECEVPRSLYPYHWVDLFDEGGYDKLMKAIKARAAELERSSVQTSKVDESNSILTENSKAGQYAADSAASEKAEPEKIECSAATNIGGNTSDSVIVTGDGNTIIVNPNQLDESSNILKKKRVLEAAIEEKVRVGQPALLFVRIRRSKIKSIIHFIFTVDERVSIDQSSVRNKETKIEFPIKNGEVQPAKITLRLVAPDFDLPESQKNIIVPPDGESEICTFIVIPRKAGELLITLEAYKDGDVLANRNLYTQAVESDALLRTKPRFAAIPIMVLVSPRTIPKLKYIIAVIVAIIFTGWALVEGRLVAAPSPTPTAISTITITQSPSATFTVLPPSETSEPSLTPTEALTPIATPLYTEIIDAKGVEMILIPAGIFTMGSDKGDVDEKPVHEVDLSAFYLDKYEVTNTLYKSCVDAGVCQHPTDINSPTRSSYYGNPEFDDHPVMFVNWNMAKAYCEWRGARLPTEAEWEKAARGIDKRTYPWGEGISCSQANYRDCVGDTKVVGSFQDGASPYGAYDMAGNVWEWVQDWYSAEYYAISPGKSPSGPDSGTNHVVRGGAWDFPPEFVTSSDRFWGDQQSASNNFGFRCVRDGNFAPGPTHVIITNRGWKTYIYAGVQLKSTINVSPGTDNSFRISFNLLKGEWVAVYKKLPPKALVGSQGLSITYEGTGKPNTLEVKLISTVDTVCKVVKHRSTNTYNSKIDLNILYSELSCSSTGGNSMPLNLDNIDRIDLTFSNWPGDEPGEGEVLVYAIQSLPGP